MQVEAVIPVDEAIDIFPHMQYTLEMSCSGSLGQRGDSCHKLSVESHVLFLILFGSGLPDNCSFCPLLTLSVPEL